MNEVQPNGGESKQGKGHAGKQNILCGVYFAMIECTLAESMCQHFVNLTYSFGALACTEFLHNCICEVSFLLTVFDNVNLVVVPPSTTSQRKMTSSSVLLSHHNFIAGSYLDRKL